jgi:hypothetical protein
MIIDTQNQNTITPQMILNETWLKRKVSNSHNMNKKIYWMLALWRDHWTGNTSQPKMRSK